MQPEPIVIPANKLPKIKARFLANIKAQPNGCWLWMRGRDKDGYGKMKVLGKTECKHGHPYIESNIYLYKGQRQCRTCRAAAEARRKPRRKRSKRAKA